MPASPKELRSFFQHLETTSGWRCCGHVTKAVGNIVESEGPFCFIGECVEITCSDGNKYPGEVVGFRANNVLSMTLNATNGVRFGDQVYSWGAKPKLRVGPELLGRVVDCEGKPLDEGNSFRAHDHWPVDGDPPLPLNRVNITHPLSCGVRAIDAMLTCGRGQRVGVFGGSGVGKSTLIGMMARNTEADLTVLALVGERGREVREFLEHAIGPRGLARSVVVVSTSDQSPLQRIRAAMTATAISEYFCSEGKHVLLVVDSLTRFAMAQREIGLSAGEPPTAKGYTPSVFTRLARLIERAGNFERGSITGFYTVLMEGDDQQDPLVDAARSLLDGHIVLDRKIASSGHYPAINVLDSLSRLMPSVTTQEHRTRVMKIRKSLADYARSEDLIRVGAYQKGSDVDLDTAIATRPAILEFLKQMTI